MAVAEATFGITYDGPALEGGRMPVSELAPALLGLGDMFAVASDIVHPEWRPVSLNIQATERGSFDVHLYLEAEQVWDQLVDMFSSNDATALVNLKDLVIASGFGVFWLLKRLRGRRVIATERDVPKPGMIRLQLDDTTSLEIPSDAWALAQSVEIRKHARKVVQPLDREGIEVVEFTSIGADIDGVAIEKDDLPAYELPDELDEALLDTEQEIWTQIASVAFPRNNKWRLSVGEYTFWATIADDLFLDKVESGRESFRNGDMLRVKTEVVQTRRVDGLHTEYTVIEVLEHRPRTQLALDIGDEPTS